MPNHSGAYGIEWAEIDSLEAEGLYKSALEKVERIANKSKTEQNSPQSIKCLIYKGKYAILTGEEGIVSAISLFETEVQSAKEPEKSVIHSLLGELYSNYLSNQGYQISQRTQIVDDKSTDIRTFTAARLEQIAFDYYRASTQNAELLYAMPVEAYADILIEGTVDSTTVKYCPTLFDFLANRSLDYFQNESNYLTEPTNRFFLNDPLAFGEVQTFVAAPFESTDSTSRKLQALRTFQRILKLHLADKDPAALIQNDLMRLTFVLNNIVLDEGEKRELYRSVLFAMDAKYSNHPGNAEVLYTLAQSYQQTGNDYNPKEGQKDGEKDLKYAIDYLDRAIRMYPNSYGASQAKALKFEMERGYLQVHCETVVLPNEANLALVDFKNVDAFWWKVVRLDETQAAQYQKENYEKRWEFVKKLPEVQAKSKVALSNTKDYRTHNTEIRIDALPVGTYVLLASPDENFSSKLAAESHVVFQTSVLTAVELQSKDKTMFAVVHRKTGQPMKGVEAIFYDQNWEGNQLNTNEVSRVKSDANGFVEGPDEKEGRRSLQAKFKLGADVLDKNSYWYSYSQGKNPNRQEAVFFTDRAIYRPGQTIYFKALFLERNADNVPSIVPNKTAEVILYDVNRQEVAKQNLTSNEFGSIQGSFTAPSSGLMGQMTMQINAPYGMHYFNVEEYKRPKFEVTVDAPAQSVRVGETVVFKGKATAFAGSAVDGAKVQYRIQRTARLPWWWGWCGWRSPWWSSRSAEIKNGTVETGADGSFEISFTAEPDREIAAEDKPEFNYEITVDVTDITGETQSGSAATTVGYVAMKANFPLRETMSVQELQKMALSLSDLNGKPLAAKGSITVQPVLKPKKQFKTRYWEKPDVWTLEKGVYDRDFADFSYKNEDEPMEWPRQDITWVTTFETPKDSLLDISKGKVQAGAAYLIRFESKDAYGNPLKIERVVQIYDDADKLSRVQAGDVLFFEKNSYQPNETAKLYYGTPFENQALLLWYGSISKTSGFVWKNAKPATESLTIAERDRGALRASSVFVRNNRVYGSYFAEAMVPWTNKELQIEYGTFRDKLYPGQAEEWRIKISGSKKDAVAAEMVAAMYDASLDQFAPQSWQRSFFPMNSPLGRIGYSVGFSEATGDLFYPPFTEQFNIQYRSYPALNWFNFPMYGGYDRMYKSARVMRSSAPNAQYETTDMSMSEVQVSAPMAADPTAGPTDYSALEGESAGGDAGQKKEKPAPNPVRTNLKETVFFFPNLRTDANGDILVKFTMNEALTRWKFLTFVHTKDMAYAFSEKSVLTQKDLMVLPNAPRFFREGDAIQFAAKVSNLSKESLTGTATLELFDAITMQPIQAAYGLNEKTSQVNFTSLAGQSDLVTWTLKVPKDGTGALVWRVVAKSGQFSDGEEAALPVVTNRTLVTETLPLAVRGNQEKIFELGYLRDYTSKSLTHHQYSLEFTSNPAWYAVQAMPYLMEYPHQCSEQIFSRLYANSLAKHVANTHPQIQRVYQSWKGTDALKSNLSKNHDLKTALLEETPWVLDAQSEEQQKQNIALLFDLNKMADEQARAITQLAERQSSNGGFAWFPDGRPSWYITQHIAEGFEHLKHLGVDLAEAQDVQRKAMNFCTQEFKTAYRDLEKEVQNGKAKWEDDHLDNLAAHYLYTRSFSLLSKNGKRVDANLNGEKELAYYLGQAEKYWKTRSIYTQGQLALALHRFGKTAVAEQIVRSLRERAIQKEELGMYWAFDYGYYFYQMPVETQALMVEVFDEVANDKAAVDELRIWLLKNKQTNHWKTTKATAEAVYALLLGGDNWLENAKIVSVQVGKMDISPKANQTQTGTVYFKKTFAASEVNKDMAKVTVKNPNPTIAWGAAYWQYFEDLDKVKDFKATPLTIQKELFLVKNTANGPKLTKIEPNASLQTGDRIKVRIEIRCDRAMEYVHLKDMRAAAFEPTNVLSGYRWQDGLGYYESTGDLATNFFIDYLPKGTFVFEYTLVATQKGEFSNGVTTMQCMYAPEFSSHSEGVRVSVK